MKYSDFIKGNENFQYSINLQYDIDSIEKIRGYIPTNKALEILNEYLLNTVNKGGNKSTVLIGPYGKGKSHLLLVLLSLLGPNKNMKVLNEFLEKVININPKYEEVIQNSINDKRYLPVIINSNSLDLNQAFLIALRNSLSKFELMDIFPKTYFDSAVEIIEGWEKYSDTNERLKRIVKEQVNVDLDVYKKQLKKCDQSAFNVFKEIFKEITSGVEFNPLTNTDIVKFYEEVNHYLKDKYDYDGMIVVFDEFSKFIEASSSYNAARDLKILQDFAELASRSSNPQLHLICVTHKTVNEYIKKIPQEKLDAWRAIEGRFKEVYFNSSAQQNYELISNAIIKNKDILGKFIENNSKKYDELLDDSYDIYKHLYSLHEFYDYIAKGCFPLNPYSTYVLPRISEKVAQNERTLFTFLSKDERNSLIEFVRNNNGNLELININNIYDYFENLFKKETFNEGIYNIWIKANGAIEHAESEEEANVYKALSIIYILSDFNNLAPDINTIRKCLGNSKDESNELINKMRDNGKLMYKKSSDTYDFMPLSSVNVIKQIKIIAESKIKNYNESDILNDLTNLKPIIPKQYNDEYKMVRYFKHMFLSINELTAYDNVEDLLNNKNSDGILVNLLYKSNEELVEAKKWLDNVNDSRVIFILPDKIVKFEELIKEYLAIKELLQDQDLLNEDSAIETQLNMLLEDRINGILNLVELHYNYENKESSILNKEKKEDITRKSQMSTLVSKIAYKYYGNTPKVNNEMINKNIISAPILKARNNIINMLLDDSYKEFDCSGSSVDSTLFRATLKNKGLVESIIDDDMEILINEIKEFIINSEENEQSFNILYENIITSKKGIGLRRGILPIYISYLFKDYKDEVIIYLNGRVKKELDLTVEELNNINNKPKDYLLRIEKGTKEKEHYISVLQEIFGVYLNGRKSTNKYADLVKSMQNWIQSLSKYCRTHEISYRNATEISKNIIKFRKAITKFDINNRSFLYTDLLNIMETDSYEECLNKIIDMKKYLDEFDRNIKEYLVMEIKQLFNSSEESTLTGAMKVWFNNRTEEQKDHLFDSGTNHFMNEVRYVGNNDLKFIDKLSDIAIGLAIEDWNDNTINEFYEEIKRMKKIIEEYEVACDNDTENGVIKIGFVKSNGEVEEKTFNKTEITGIGGTLLNSIEEVFEEYGDSIEDNEKRNILIKMLEKFI